MSRGIAKLKFRLLGRATIIDIPTDRFHELKLELENEGWNSLRESIGLGTWINHDDFSLRRGVRKIRFEWDNWTEGSIEGSKAVIEEIAAKDKSLKIVEYWRWSIYD